MRKGRPVALVTVTAEQRLELESWSRRPKTAHVGTRSVRRASGLLETGL
jgi:hypothetical protein